MSAIKPEFENVPQPKLLPWLRLMRLPNVFTAISDSAMGFLFLNSVNELSASGWSALALLCAASACLYTAGMVLNDVFDIEIDRAERPFRPLPSGQLSFPTARRLGIALLVLGVALGSLAGFVHRENTVSSLKSGILAALVAASVLLYDGGLKRTPMGPLGMGLCRFFNILLGMSVANFALDNATFGYPAASWLIAGGVGVYIVGVTWFARNEAEDSRSDSLVGALLMMAIGMGLVGAFPFIAESPQPFRTTPQWFAMLVAVLFLPIVSRAISAITDPQPQNVQQVIKSSLMSLILFDAAIATMTAGPAAGLAIAALLLPSLLLGRWVYST